MGQSALPLVGRLPVPAASHCSLSASQGMELSRTLCSERGPSGPPLPRLVAPDLPSCPSRPQANLAWPWSWREKEATAALSEARTVPPATAHALSPEDKEILGDQPTGRLSGEASGAPEMPVFPSLGSFALPVSKSLRAKVRGRSGREPTVCAQVRWAQPYLPTEGSWDSCKATQPS